MDFSRYLSSTWEIFVKNLTQLVILTIMFILLSIVTFGILSPVMQAGYTRSILKMIQEDHKPAVADLFTELSMFFPLSVILAVIIIAILTGFLLTILPGVIVLFFVLLLQQYFFQFLVTERKGVFAAARSSWDFIFKGKKTLDHIVVMILVFLSHSAGGTVFFGLLLTIPLTIIFLSVIFINERKGEAAGENSFAKQGSDR